MNRYVSFFVFIFIFSVVSADSAISQEKSNPEYLTIITDFDNSGFLSSSKIYISVNGEKYKEKKIPKSEIQGKYDYNPLINIIREYNKLGWKIMNSNLSFSFDNKREKDYIFILMRRDEPYEIDQRPVDTIIRKNQ
ncbi:MAG: hypothetical protein ACQESJ_02980 [Bacteroidota bacterium]